MATDSILLKVYEIFEGERESNQLTSVPPSLYRDVANYIKSMRNGSEKEGKSATEMVVQGEIALLSKIVIRLMRLRVKKILQSLETESNGPALTAEEKYIIDPLITSAKRASRLEKAIGSGRTSFLETITEKSVAKYVTVRFLKDTPSTVGVDLQKYGPFMKEDIAVLPAENVRPLVRQKTVQELDIDV